MATRLRVKINLQLFQVYQELATRLRPKIYLKLFKVYKEVATRENLFIALQVYKEVATRLRVSTSKFIHSSPKCIKKWLRVYASTRQHRENLFRFIQSECDNGKIPNIQHRKQSEKCSKLIRNY